MFVNVNFFFEDGNRNGNWNQATLLIKEDEILLTRFYD